MFSRLHSRFSEETLRRNLHAVLSKPEADSLISALPLLFAKGLLILSIATIGFAGFLLVIRVSIPVPIIAGALIGAGVTLLGASMMVWDYARIAKILIRILQKRDRTDQ